MACSGFVGFDCQLLFRFGVICFEMSFEMSFVTNFVTNFEISSELNSELNFGIDSVKYFEIDFV